MVSELRGERIDIVPYNDEPARFVAKALSPARVREVLVDDEGRSATIIVPDDQLSLAIGKEGQNARLASKLTGWRIDIKSQSEMADNESELAYAEDGDDVSGHCVAVMSNGKRCPNMALPGSRYCGIPAHQKLAEAETGGAGGGRVTAAPESSMPRRTCVGCRRRRRRRSPRAAHAARRRTSCWPRTRPHGARRLAVPANPTVSSRRHAGARSSAPSAPACPSTTICAGASPASASSERR